MKRLSAFILAIILCFTIISPSAFAASSVRDTTGEAKLATDLKSLGLFKGVSDTDYALDRAPTRTEALVMLIRALGKENEALNGTWTDPFTDVPSWADKYVGYAYQNGLTYGTTATQFGTGNASANMYLTFVLRSLGYVDNTGLDFYWDQPYALARSLNILPDNVQLTDFIRADVVTISYAALDAKMKNSTKTLSDKLISAGVFTEEAFNTYYDPKAIASLGADTVLSSEEIYSKCSPAVFYLETYNSKGTKIASASGFFIDSSGTAVTNFHALKGAYSAKITTSDTNTTYNVLGVYDYNKDEDWAILKIDGKGFSYLTVADSSSVVGGAPAYALGCPLGLSDTLSEGLISNPKRYIEDNDTTYIQTSAAISVGSSGGALLDKYGRVVGITTATTSLGQNINLALPINIIRGYTSTSYKTLLAVTMNDKSQLLSYAGYPEIPDCGAYYGVDIFKSFTAGAESTYYYTVDSVDLAGGWVDKTSSYSYPKYMDLLAEWGFTYVTEFAVGQSYYWQFTYSSDSDSYLVIVGTTTYNNVKCVSVEIIKT